MNIHATAGVWAFNKPHNQKYIFQLFLAGNYQIMYCCNSAIGPLNCTIGPYNDFLSLHTPLISFVYITWRLLHVYVFSKITIEECSYNIHLMNLHSLFHCICQDCTNGGKMSNWRECFLIINTVFLGSPLNRSTLP